MSNNPLPFGFRPELASFPPDPQNVPYAPPGYPGGPTAPGYPGDAAALSYPGGPTPAGYPAGPTPAGYPTGPAALSYSGGPSAPGYPHGSMASGYSSAPTAPEKLSGRTTFENSRAGTDAARHNIHSFVSPPQNMNSPASQPHNMNSFVSQPHNMNSPASQLHNMNFPVSQPPYMNPPVSQPPYMNAPVSQHGVHGQTPGMYPNLPAFGTSNSGGTQMHVQHTYNPPLQSGNTQFGQGPAWMKWHKGQLIPSNAVQGGTDVDNAKIYVGRLYHKGDLLPAKIMPEKNVAYISYNGEEIDYYECEVLCQRNVKWIASSNGNVPPGAIRIGQTQSRESLYAGRVHHKGSVCVGKVHPSHGVCYIPFGGEEKAHRNYEVLVG